MLADDVQYVKGVGPRRGEALGTHGIRTCGDLLHFFPRRYVDKSTIAGLRDVVPGMDAVTIIGRVLKRNRIRRGRRPYLEIIIEDARGDRLKGVWFNAIDWIFKRLPEGNRVAFYGKLQSARHGQMKSMAHPDFDNLDEDGPSLDTGRILPLYPGGMQLQRVGLKSRRLRRVIYGLFLSRGLELWDNLPPWARQRHNLIDGRVALRAVHLPKSYEELEKARERLKYEELFFFQLAIARYRQHLKKIAGTRFKGPGQLYETFLNRVLPFTLTNGQKNALKAICTDTTGGYRMNRLIQGDVGCGKTVVGVAALLLALDSGYQGAFMAPTEILAEQHYANLRQYLEPLDVRVRLLIGKQRKTVRTRILQEIASGEAQIVVGTHAVIQQDVTFKNLAMAVVDEQHRFGVLQRASLYEKGKSSHVLLMTATPIPRSLALTVYGDLDVTAIRELPSGRRPIKTYLLKENRRASMMDLLRRELAAGNQAYVVYPLVEKSEKVALQDAENGMKHLRNALPEYSIDLIHGRMKQVEKDAVMERFKNRETVLLVATTVIEVGVDAPHATVMVIEHAERFGLAQLHQLRGRVGRGSQQAYCILMASYQRSQVADERLKVLVNTADGFKISEADMKLRGAGDFSGTRQSGLPEFKIADIVEDQALLIAARKDAADLVARDPTLEAPEHARMREYYLEHYRRGEGALFAVG